MRGFAGAVLLVLTSCAAVPSAPRETHSQQTLPTLPGEPDADSRRSAVRPGDQSARVEPAGPDAARADTARAELARAEQLMGAGRFDEADTVLQQLATVEYPEIPALALLLRGRVAAARGQPSAASYLFKQALESGPSVAARYETNLALGDLRYEAGDPSGAFGYYLEALGRVPAGNRPEDRLWLRLAEIAHYTYRNRELARYYLLQAPGLTGEKSDNELLRRLVRRISWTNLPAETLGLGDGNVSAVSADDDDLWIGTWNGGVVRYSLSNQQAVVFREGRESLTANTVRAIEVTDTRVWVGTYQGLFVYSKPTATWSEVPVFGGNLPKRAEAIKAVGDDLYVGTLGDGLWRLRDGRWLRIGDDVLPGEFINSLARADSWLLIGTLNLGIALLDLEKGTFLSFDRVNGGLKARNIIMLLPEGDGELWIGTYGEGLYRWDRLQNHLAHFRKDQGQLGDDWILCGASTATGVYFGTFGAGVSRYRDDSWRVIGLREGLGGLDITAVTYSPPYVIFGTLGSGITMFDESLALAGFAGVQQ
jgi:tetratricopeptide (TPR) repeat protein